MLTMLLVELDGGPSCSTVPVRKVVHVPASSFPEEEAPPEGYWVGKTVATGEGGTGDIGIKIPDQDIFTWPRTEVALWLVDA